MRRNNNTTVTKIHLLSDDIAVSVDAGEKGAPRAKAHQPCRTEGAVARAQGVGGDVGESNSAAICARDMTNSIEGIASTINRLNEIAFNHALASENQSATVVAEVRRNIQEAARGIQVVSNTLGKLKSRILDTGERNEDIMSAALALDVQSSALQGAVAVLTGKIKHL